MGKEKVVELPAKEMDDRDTEQETKIRDFIDTVWEPMRKVRREWEAAGGGEKERPEGDQMLLPTYAALSDEDRYIQCYKFLVARQYDLEKAEEMLRQTCKYKHDNRLEEQPLFPPAIHIRGWDVAEVAKHHGETSDRQPGEVDRVFQHITPFYQSTYHKWDKWGHPLFLEATGNTAVVGLVEKLKQLCPVNEKPQDPLCRFHVHFNEVGARLVKFNDARIGPQVERRVLGVVGIMDCTKLGMGHLHTPALDLLKAAWGIDQQYYPEGLHALYAVNCPGMIMFAYNIVKGWLDPRVRAKIRFVKPEKTTETLLQVVDADNLPAHLGGNCVCEGGCIYGMDGSVPPPEDDPQHISELFVVGSGKKETREVRAELGDVVVWEYVVSDERNVMFSAVFVPDGDEEENARELYLPTKERTMDCRHQCEGPGRLILTFSNEYSWVRSKSITLRLFITK